MISDSNHFQGLQECRAQVGELSAMSESELLNQELQNRVKGLAAKALSIGEQIQPQCSRQLREHIGEYRSLASDIGLISQKIQRAQLALDPSASQLSLELTESERLLQALGDRLEAHCDELGHEATQLNEEAEQATHEAVAAKNPIELQNEQKVDERKRELSHKQIFYRLAPLSDDASEQKHTNSFGDLYSNAVSFFRDDIQCFEEFLNSDPSTAALISERGRDQLHELKHSLSEGAVYARDIELIGQLSFDQHSDLADKAIGSLVERIEDRVRNLAIGESMFLPGGTSAHAIAYKLTRTSDQQYSFEIFDTGVGVLEKRRIVSDFGTKEDFVKSDTVALVEKYGVFVPQIEEDDAKITANPAISLKWEDCTLTTLLESDFLKDQILAATTQPPLTVLQILESKLKSGIGRPVCSTRHHIQSGGSCTYDSILAYAKGSLSSPVYHALHLFLMRRSSTRIEDLASHQLKITARNTPKSKNRFIERKVKKWYERADPRATQLAALVQSVLAYAIPTSSIP